MSVHTEIWQIYPAGSKPAFVMELLYNAYREENRPEPENIRLHFAELNAILEKLPLEEMDVVWYRVCELCVAHEKTAFLDGVRIGARLVNELDEG